MFCWRQNSQQIFNKILASHSVDDSETESESDTDDDLSTAFSVFDSPRTPTRRYQDQDEEIERKLNLWTDLTNICMGPFANPDRMKSVQTKKQPPPCVRSFSEGCTIRPSSSISDAKDTLTVKFQYLIITERLKVTVSRAGDLKTLSEDDTDVELFARVGLFPSKSSYKDTPVVKGSRNPEFNSVMYFNGISLENMHEKSLKLALYCKIGKESRFKVIGESSISLENIDLTTETTLEKAMKPTTQMARGGSSRHLRGRETNTFI